MELEETEEITPKNILNCSGDTEIELDLPPEYCHYHDEGCGLASS